MITEFPALRCLLESPGRLFPEEREELVFVLGRIARLEVVEKDANALIDAMTGEALTTPAKT